MSSMERPQLEPILAKVREIGAEFYVCSCGQWLNNLEAITEHWERGHMDRPSTEIQEMKDRITQLEKMVSNDNLEAGEQFTELNDEQFEELILAMREAREMAKARHGT